MATKRHEIVKTMIIGHSGVQEIEVYTFGNEINLDVESDTGGFNIYLKPDEVKEMIAILQEASKKIARNALMQLGD